MQGKLWLFCPSFILIHSGYIYISGVFFKSSSTVLELSVFVWALRVLLDLNGPDHPHLGPHPPLHLSLGAYFSSARTQQPWLSHSLGVPVFASWVDLGLNTVVLSSGLSPAATSKRILNKQFLQRQRIWWGSQKAVNCVTATGCKKTAEQC